MSEEDRNGAAGADSGDMSTADKKRQATADALMRKITTSAKQPCSTTYTHFLIIIRGRLNLKNFPLYLKDVFD